MKMKKSPTSKLITSNSKLKTLITGDLRRKAEEHLGKEKAKAIQTLSDEDVQKLVHELEVHQIELEMQNEALYRARMEADVLEKKYFDLYDFAPIGYFRFDGQGTILEVNLTGAEMLGQNKVNLINRRFQLFITPERKHDFNDFCKKVIETGVKYTCEVEIMRIPPLLKKGRGDFKEDDIVNAIMEGVVIKGEDYNKQIMAALIDITARKKAEEGIQRLNEELEQRVVERTQQLDFTIETLKKEIKEHKELSQEILRQSALLSGINKVLGEALICQTEEEIGRICLSVAEELTGSKFGFICEINETGCLDSIAISNPGWDACNIPEKEAKFLIQNLEIRGILGRVVMDGRPIISNDPPSHPDWVGIPEGHPMVTSFLGVPLRYLDKTIGMIGLGNKESGYTFNDQQAVETLTVAFVEALMRKRTEISLHENQARLRYLLSASPAIIYSATAEKDMKPHSIHSVTFISENIKTILGYDPQELLKNSTFWWDCVHLEDRVLIKNIISLLYEEDHLAIEYRFLHKDGHYLWLYDEMSLQYDLGGKAKEIVGSLFDITNRKRVEQKLFETKALLERTFASLHDAAFIIDTDTVEIKECNPTASNIFGYSRHEMIGRTTTFLHVDEASLEEFRRHLFNAMKEKRFLNQFEFKMRRQDGTIFPTEHSVMPLEDEEGKRIGWLSIVRDITERKQAEEALKRSEERFRKLFDEAPVAYHQYDQEGRITQVNNTMLEMMGYTADEMIGHNTWEFVEEGIARQMVEKKISGILPPGKAFERNIIRKDGTRFTALIEDRLINDDRGKIIGVRSTIQDITQIKLLQSQLIQSEKLASLGLLISGIAHEINNPNSFITFNLPILQDYLNRIMPIVERYASDHPDYELFGMPYPEFRKDLFSLLKNIEHGAERIKITISKLREFSKLRDQQKLYWINLKEVVESALALCQSELKKKVKSFEMKVSDKVPQIFSDPGPIEQVIINILVNAIQAVDKEESWIRLSVIEGEKPEEPLIIEISDNGTGIESKSLGKIFDPFLTLNRSGTGTGLGLYISSNLIEGLGGSIEVDSELGKGSTFRIKLSIKSETIQ